MMKYNGDEMLMITMMIMIMAGWSMVDYMLAVANSRDLREAYSNVQPAIIEAYSRVW